MTVIVVHRVGGPLYKVLLPFGSSGFRDTAKLRTQ